jgi:hypothetical protein
MEGAMIRPVFDYLKLLKKIGGPLPWTICVSLLEVTGFWLYASDGQGRTNVFDETDVLAPPIVLTTIPEPLDSQAVAKLLRPAIDFIWREFGFTRSCNYTDTGIYNVRRPY